MAGWKAKSVLTGGVASGPVAVGASQTNSVLTATGAVPVRTGGNMYCVIDVNVTAVTVAAAVTLKIQDSPDGTNWFDKKTLAVTTTGWKTLALNNYASGDQTYLPLRPLARLVVTTGAGDSISVGDVLWSSEWGG